MATKKSAVPGSIKGTVPKGTAYRVGKNKIIVKTPEPKIKGKRFKVGE